MRGRRAKKRTLQKDGKYNSELVAKFVNSIMLHGKKTMAEKIFYEALEEAAKEVKLDPMEFLNTVVDNVRPALEIRARRVGGANYQIPVPVSPSRQETLVVRWMIEVARKKSGAPFVQILKRELMDAFKQTGDVIKKREDTERMAEANKAFAHFRW